MKWYLVTIKSENSESESGATDLEYVMSEEETNHLKAGFEQFNQTKNDTLSCVFWYVSTGLNEGNSGSIRMFFAGHSIVSVLELIDHPSPNDYAKARNAAYEDRGY